VPSRPYIRAVTLLKQSDPDLKYEVFTRLNTGGEPLLPQEIRNVLYPSEAAQDRQRKAAGFQQMQDAEMALRFLALRDSSEALSGD